MPPNPLTAIRDYLRGEDLKTVGGPALQTAIREPRYRKIEFHQDIGAAITLGTLVHGPGATDLIQGVYGPDGNSAVFACLNAIATAYPEAPLRVFRAGSEPGQRDLMSESPLQGLLDRPNPHMSADEVWFWVQWAKHCDGNAYLRKIRSGRRNVVELWPVSPRLLQPITEKGSTRFIDWYKFNYAPGKWERIEVEDIIHFRLGVNDADHRLGLSPLKRLVAEVGTDAEATRFSDALLGNYGVPGLVVTVPPDTQMTEADALAMKERIGSAFGSKNRGNVGVLTAGAKMEAFGFSPEMMDLKAIHRIPEERISAVLRVPAIIAGLGAGLDRATYANFREARAMFVEQTILPLYQFDAGVVNSQLVPDFTSDRRVYVQHDITDMRALQEDETAKYTRLDLGVKTGWIDPDEARADVGLPPRGNQAPPLTPGKSLLYAMKQAGTFDDYPALMEAMVELARPGLEADLEEYFSEQRKRLKRKLLASG